VHQVEQVFDFYNGNGLLLGEGNTTCGQKTPMMKKRVRFNLHEPQMDSKETEHIQTMVSKK
jgi:hypothetical protein